MLKRKTVVSTLVLHLFKHQKRPLSVSEILQELSLLGKTPNKTTIYRILDKCVQSKLISRIPLNNGIQYFELNTGAHHHHFFCTICSKLICLSSCAVDSRFIRSMIPSSEYVVESHDFNLYGKCHSCQESPA